MKTILINTQGYVKSPYIKDANIELEITEAQFEQISYFYANCAWRFIPESKEFKLEPLLADSNLRDRRNIECFNLIDNKSTLWFNHLTASQKQELDKWYQDWLDVTTTKVIPIKPEWLK